MATKPMKRAKRFDEGDLVTGTTNVRTRSDDVIGDTNPRTGVYTPGSYDARQKAGESNLNAVKGLWNRITGGSSDDSGTGTRGLRASASSGPSESDTAKAKVISDSFKPKASEVDRPSQSTISGKQVDQDNTGSYDTSSSSSSSDTEDKKPEVKEDKKPVVKEDKKPAAKTVVKTNDSASKNYGAAVGSQPTKKSTDTTDSSSKNYGNAVGSQPAKKAAEEKKPETKAADTKPAAKTDYYRGSDGKMHPKTPEPAPKSEDEWGTQNIKRNLQNAPGDVMKGLKKVGSALSNFETLAERRSREAKEAKNKPVAKRSGGAVKKMASGGSVKSSASSRGDGIASRGKTRGKIY